MSDQPIDFYFEFASPYGYLASLEIESVAEKYGRAVNWRPFMRWKASWRLRKS